MAMMSEDEETEIYLSKEEYKRVMVSNHLTPLYRCIFFAALIMKSNSTHMHPGQALYSINLYVTDWHTVTYITPQALHEAYPIPAIKLGLIKVVCSEDLEVSTVKSLNFASFYVKVSTLFGELLHTSPFYPLMFYLYHTRPPQIEEELAEPTVSDKMQDLQNRQDMLQNSTLWDVGNVVELAPDIHKITISVSELKNRLQRLGASAD